MNYDLKTIKALTELGLRDEEDLTPEQEHLLQLALDPETKSETLFLDRVEQLFTQKDSVD